MKLGVLALVLAVVRAHNFPHGYECSTCTDIVESVALGGKTVQEAAARWGLEEEYYGLNLNAATLSKVSVECVVRGK